MRCLSLVVMLLVSACATPSPDMFGGVRHEVTVDGVDFVVFHRESEAEIVRMGYLARPQRAQVPALMIRAAGLATGCRVIADSMTARIANDSGVARVALDCRSATVAG